MTGPQDGQEAVVETDRMVVSGDPEADLYLLHDRELPDAGVTIAVQNGRIIIEDGGETQSAAPGELFRVGGTWLKVVVL